MRCDSSLLLGGMLLAATLLTSPLPAADELGAPPAKPQYTLRYKFRPGETLRWETNHTVKVKSTVSGSTQVAETTSKSVKAWKVIDVRENGRSAFEHSVEYVDMVNRITGREDATYDSRKDTKPSAGFEDVAKNIGVTLTRMLMDNRGGVIERKDRHPDASSKQMGQMTMPLPEQAVSVGDTWNMPDEVELKLKDGSPRKVKLRQACTLEAVDNGVARIKFETQILTPSNSPELQVQLVQRKTKGVLRFDIERGRTLGQIVEIDERVVGFHTEASSMHHQSRFSETLLDGKESTARVSGPEPPVK